LQNNYNILTLTKTSGKSMLFLSLELLAMLALILIAAEIFTNALEHLGEKLGISEGVTGSLFAAVGTALPEALVPIIAIFGGTANHEVNEEIGVGAILGAPLMLSTLAVFLMSISDIKSRGWNSYIKPERTGFIRDLNFFIVAFIFAAIAMYIPHESIHLRLVVSSIMVLMYVAYIFITFASSKHLVAAGHATEADKDMFFTKLGLKDTQSTIYIQIAAGLILLIVGAKGFIYGIEGISEIIHISPLILSLLLIPIATELPEKVNSILWVRRGKDTMAVGNITGAMVFQGTLLPALGIMLTPWLPTKEVLPSIIITILAAVWLRSCITKQGLAIKSLMVCGGLYAIYLFISLA
jgi:cation:H+ antiporter